MTDRTQTGEIAPAVEGPALSSDRQLGPSHVGAFDDTGSRRAALIGLGAFAVVLIGGLTWAKWWPYTHKVFKVLEKHTVGTSILTGGKHAPPAPSWHAAASFARSYFDAIWIALAAALLIAAAVEAFLPRRWLLRVLVRGHKRYSGPVAGGLLAIPSMMCTCCSAPLTVSVRRQGAPVSSSLAYWVGNPILNPAVLVFMAIVLPWQWVTVRIVIGAALVFVLVPLVARLQPADHVAGPTWSEEDVEPAPGGVLPAANRYVRALARLAVTLLPEYLVIVLLVGATRGWLFPASHHLGAWAVLLFAVVGTLFVIPTAGEIPIIQGFLKGGFGAGPVGALLVTLPALSLPSMVMVSRALSTRVVLSAAAVVAGLGLVTGLLLWALGA